ADEISAELIFDMDADDVVEIAFGGGEAKLTRALGLEIARPAVDDAHDEGIGLALDAGCGLFAPGTLERRDLLGNGRGKAGHAQAPARTGGGQIHRAGVEEEAHRGTRCGMPVANGLR